VSAAVYAALLRRDADQVVPEPQPYRTALNLIRDLVLSDELSGDEVVAEIVLIFTALVQVQEELDAREAGR
jgi:hypothetical protein